MKPTPLGRIDSLFRYPVKGLSPERLENVVLVAGRGFPADRIFALARPDGPYRSGASQLLGKKAFYALVTEERLAGLSTRLAPGSSVLSVDVQGHRLLDADLSTEAGRHALTALLARVLDLPGGIEPVVASEAGLRFPDLAAAGPEEMQAVSLVNLASVRALEAKLGTEIDPLRFRANIYFDGPEAFAERELLGSTVEIGGSRLEVFEETVRCAATDANPTTARRDTRIPAALKQHFGHAIMGFYAHVRSNGTLAPGMDIALEHAVEGVR